MTNAMPPDAAALPHDLLMWLHDHTALVSGGKFIEGWRLHERGFPITALVSAAAKCGWYSRETAKPPGAAKP